jgi:hypothetical protein
MNPCIHSMLAPLVGQGPAVAEPAGSIAGLMTLLVAVLFFFAIVYGVIRDVPDVAPEGEAEVDPHTMILDDLGTSMADGGRHLPDGEEPTAAE